MFSCLDVTVRARFHFVRDSCSQFYGMNVVIVSWLRASVYRAVSTSLCEAAERSRVRCRTNRQEFYRDREFVEKEEKGSRDLVRTRGLDNRLRITVALTVMPINVHGWPTSSIKLT